MASQKNNNLDLNPILFRSLQKYLLENLGLNFTGTQKRELLKRIDGAAGKFNFDDVGEFINWILKKNLSYNELEKLSSFLTIGETYFLREPKTYNYLQFSFLPELIRKRRENSKRIRIWSAGCATGEEVYSLAIILSQVLVDYRKWDIQIIGSDINPNFLEKAKRGEYTNWSFRNCPDNFTMNYFDKIGLVYRIKEQYKKIVTFQSLNIMTSEYGDLLPEGEYFDIIFCRNVMIYFSQENIDKVADKFYSVLDSGGVLLTGLVEMSALNDSAFSRIIEDGLTRFVKTVTPSKKQQNKASNIFSRDWIENHIAMKAHTAQRKATLAQAKDEINKHKVKTIIVPNKQHVVTNPDARPQKLFEQAVQLYEKGEFELSKGLLKKIHTDYNYKEFEVTYLLIKSEANVGNYEIALKLCDEAIIEYNFNSRLYYLYANICLELQMNDEALKNLRKAIYLKPDFVLAHYLMGNLLQKRGSADADTKQKKIIIDIIEKLDEEIILLESDGMTIHEFKKMINL